ncbi:hypothetical protein J1N35_011273 [Gossypium stocksii]|uniref:Uncharacterized protein n=1 Tax=Gossypium stocksii TaxID=47602 RepID=A0A9D4AD96_9ROSI|nr:hypothetical protein J1N35_011273 [Gossypium stocksii]
MKQNREEIAKKFKVLSCTHSVVSDEIFTRIIITSEIAKNTWDKLKEEFERNDRTKQIEVLNLGRKFEVLKMKESKIVKDNAGRFTKVVNQFRLHGEDHPDKGIIEKVLVGAPERLSKNVFPSQICPFTKIIL